MTIFSRRSIQREMDALGEVLNANELKKVVGRLNGEDAQSLATEWEVMVLAGLSRLGHVHNEVSLGSSEPDILFRSNSDPKLEFLADVTAPSDQGLDEVNAFDKLSSLVGTYAAKLGIPPGGFYIYPGYRDEPARDGYKVQLGLPDKGQMEGFFHREVLSKLKFVADHPGEPQEFHIPHSSGVIVIKYQPGTKYSGGGYRAYQNATSLESNPLFLALKSKRGQLKRANYAGPAGIIVCDGGCTILQNRLKIAHDTYSAKQIVNRFLQQTKTISFVLLIRVDVDQPNFLNLANRRFVPGGDFFLNPKAAYALPEALYETLRRIPEKWPAPVQTPQNARIELDGRREKGKKHRGHSFWGGWKRSGDTMRISARGLLELLAGEKTPAEFAEAHGMVGDNSMPNPFARALVAGQMIDEIKVIPVADQDDDWIEVTLSRPNPALAKFKMPDQK